MRENKSERKKREINRNKVERTDIMERTEG